jgi:hypothetical protein
MHECGDSTGARPPAVDRIDPLPWGIYPSLAGLSACDASKDNVAIVSILSWEGKPGYMEAHTGASSSVLVADDDAAFRGFLAGLLHDAGYRVLAAETAEEAVELALAEDVDFDSPLMRLAAGGRTDR